MLPSHVNVRFGELIFDQQNYRLGIKVFLHCPTCYPQPAKIVFFKHQGLYYYGCSQCRTKYFEYDWNPFTIREYAYHHLLGMQQYHPSSIDPTDFADETCEKFIRYHC